MSFVHAHAGSIVVLSSMGFIVFLVARDLWNELRDLRQHRDEHSLG